jgi:EAL domain-containing protein (putative c-di-GMP-specific phosphodiesterase class I)
VSKRPAPPERASPSRFDEVEGLRLQSVLTDGVTGLSLLPDLRNERVPSLGVIYVQLGRFSGVESLYGWELYDRVLQLTAESLRADMATSPLRGALLSIQFTGADGFYLLFDLRSRSENGRRARLEDEARRFKDGVVQRLRQGLGRTSVDLMTVHATCLKVADDPRVRPSRNVMRGLQEATRLAGVREGREREQTMAQFKSIVSGRKLRAVYQPVLDIQHDAVIGYEALIRGPAGGELESPDVLFAAAREVGLELEFDNLCLETIFGGVPAAARGKKLFVNASSKLLAHSVFLDERNLSRIQRAHPSVVVEISEKEVVIDYAAFREVLERLRSSGLEIAIDDAGSGYSGLESILQLRPEYIKVAESIVHRLHQDTIKREIITALASLGRQINAALVAEGIEERAELESLLALGVGYGQGFLLGRPRRRMAAAH